MKNKNLSYIITISLILILLLATFTGCIKEVKEKEPKISSELLDSLTIPLLSRLQKRQGLLFQE